MDCFTKEHYIAYILLMLEIPQHKILKLYQSDIDYVREQYNLALLEISDKQLE
ncbi:hypothetical protein MTR12_10805 [Staphylococcus agnetis]|uniref:hypothetical protein n=1 Tax=Staphylococcus agnetis TaxID=985762 RepID=UPI00208E2244|nr:hypothetical protein [Staphylococcus agnetis]MCO4356041.1 hypothetical protein [Staphylococcus agnetis]MCO4365804.1 hypothetical protein [Staphylococcus agnetis]